MEETLTESRADLLLQSITDYAIYMLDREGHVSTWNVGAERLKGYSPEQIIGQHFSRFYTDEDRAAGIPDMVLSTTREKGRFEAEGWRVRRDGSRFWASIVLERVVDRTGKHIGFAKITRDLSERRNADEALRRSEERFRLLVQGVTDYAIYMLDPEGFVSSWNAGAQRFKGYTADEIIGQHFSRFYPDVDREAGVPQEALATAAREGRFEAEGWRVRKDGARFWASVVIDPIRDDDGELIGFTKITRDLTERKKAQEALEASREQFFQSQKMEAIGKLTGGVAHDFNNILAAILGSLRIAQKRIAEGGDSAGFIENAVSAAERGATLTQRMLAFARKQDLQLEPVDMMDSVQSMADLLQRTIGPDITIDLSFPLRLEPVVADKVQLELAILNLVVNARDAMPAGGKVKIRGRKLAASSPEDPSVCLTVEDEGEGMDEKTLAHAVEPFFTTKGVGKGTGLGLSMVQGMVEQCGGCFKLESAVGRGTTAEICLRRADSAMHPAEEEVAEPEATATAHRILVVDDDALILLNTVTLLQDMGHEVLQAPSGEAAMAVLETNDVDLMITDFAMPGMNGALLVEKARATRPDLRAIIASGYADLPENQTLEVPRLSKPYSEAQLAKAIVDIFRTPPAQ